MCKMIQQVPFVVLEPQTYKGFPHKSGNLKLINRIPFLRILPFDFDCFIIGQLKGFAQRNSL